MHWLLHILGLDNASGVSYLLWSGFLGDIAIVTGFITWLRRAGKQHRERLAQAARHHREQLGQAAEQHKERHAQAERHHRQHLDTLRAADGPVRAGAGSNPAQEGLNADGPVVPPAAATKGMTDG